MPKAASGTGRRGRRSGARRATPLSVGDLHAALDAIAPFENAADWENVGLLAGRPEWPAGRALLAIDLTDAVAREALRRRIDTLIVYHPPIFKGIRSVTPGAGGPTTLLPDLLAARVSILALHTALDVAVGGTNDILLDIFEPVARRPLEPVVQAGQFYKLVVFVPAPEVDKLRRVLAEQGAGVIGHYSECSFELAGQGTFRGDETTQPTVGRKLVLERADEIRLEMVVPQSRLADVVHALYANHSYEEPAFDLYPLHRLAGRAAVGMGRVGLLRKPQRGPALLRRLAKHVDLSCATRVGMLERSFRSVTAVAGAFGVQALHDSTSLVLTGELKHHDALILLRRGITAVCLGHYASERPALAMLRARLVKDVKGLSVAIAGADRTPFAPLRR
jgi:putative NIF3 family GTP cyclohydrolase 1 type 2